MRIGNRHKASGECQPTRTNEENTREPSIPDAHSLNFTIRQHFTPIYTSHMIGKPSLTGRIAGFTIQTVDCDWMAPLSLVTPCETETSGNPCLTTLDLDGTVGRLSHVRQIPTKVVTSDGTPHCGDSSCLAAKFRWQKNADQRHTARRGHTDVRQPGGNAG